jgi:DNA invertase Pin-like site-specific DNA recombinase
MGMNTTRRHAPATTQLRGVIYVRQSKTGRGSASRDVQLEQDQATAKQFNINVVAIIIEPESTGAYLNRGRNRPEWPRLLNMARHDETDCVVTHMADRLSRGGGPGWAPLLDAFEASGKNLDKVVFVPSGPMSEFEIGIRAAMDREESKKISERVTLAQERERVAGRVHGGGKRAFGFVDLERTALEPSEAALLRSARRALVAGRKSLTDVAKEWNSKGVLTPRGHPWQGSVVGRTIRSPHLAGLRVHRAEGRTTTRKATWQPIFSPAEHQEIVLAMAEPVNTSVERRLLTGFVKCGRNDCGGTMHSKHLSSPAGRRYECSRCAACGIQAEALDAWVSLAVEGLLADQEVRDAVSDHGGSRAVRRLAKELEGLQSRADELAHARFVEGSMRHATYVTANQAVESAMAEIEAKLVRSRAALTPGKDPTKLWRSGSIEEQRAVLALLLTSITVAPRVVGQRAAKGAVDEERLSVLWRF